MSQMKSFLAVLVVVACLLCVGIPSVFAEDIGAEFVGKATPAFTIKDLDGNEIDINSYKDKNSVLINFWGLRCGSCIEEMPHLNAIHDKYKDKGLVIIGVNADGVNGEFLNGPRGIKNLPEKLKYLLVQDPDMKLVDIFKMEAAPLNIMINKKGIVTFYHMGYEEGDEKALEDAVKVAIE